MKHTRFKISIVLLVLIIAIAACSPPPTAAPVSGGPAATEASTSISQQVTVTPMHFDESGQAPNYTIAGQIPAIVANNDPRVQAFNTLTNGLVMNYFDEFRASLQDMPAEPISGGSSIDVQYTIVSPPGDIFSLKFDITGYSDGAAHPYHYSRTLNFNIETGQEVTLDQLFLPGSKYLQVISDTCKAELATRDIGFEMFSAGADPDPENYQNWNITADGLLITFDDYQVAAYAAGPQTVVVPFSALNSIINPQGPLGKFIQ